jgi:hypothetical protein
LKKTTNQDTKSERRTHVISQLAGKDTPSEIKRRSIRRKAYSTIITNAASIKNDLCTLRCTGRFLLAMVNMLKPLAHQAHYMVVVE